MKRNINYHYKSINLIICIYLLFFYSNDCYSQSSDQIDSITFYNAVNAGLAKYLSKIPANREYLFGFNTRDEFVNINIGNPLQIISISKDAILENNPINAFISLTRWKVPLIIDGEYRCFLDIIQLGSNYKVVGMGLRYLASDLYKFENEKELKQMKNKSLLLDYSTDSYCIVIKDISNNVIFIPFRPLSSCNTCENIIKEQYSDVEFFNILKNNHQP